MHRLKISCWAWMLAIAASDPSLAHEDTILSIGADDAIVGLPATFGPAALRVEFSMSMQDPPISAVVLDLAGHRARLPRCVTDLLKTRTMDGVRAAASWYHDEAVVPHYLFLGFSDPGAGDSERFDAGHSLLFNLHSGALIEMVALAVSDDGRTQHREIVDPAARCSPAEVKALSIDGSGEGP